MDNLSKSQKLVYDMEKYAGGSIAIICGSMLIEGTRDQTALSKAINELYCLNAGLRTRLTETDTGVAQSVIEYTEREIKILRFESKDELDRYAGEYAKEPFDLYGDLCVQWLVRGDIFIYNNAWSSEGNFPRS